MRFTIKPELEKVPAPAKAKPAPAPKKAAAEPAKKAPAKKTAKKAVKKEKKQYPNTIIVNPLAFAGGFCLGIYYLVYRGTINANKP